MKLYRFPARVASFAILVVPVGLLLSTFGRRSFDWSPDTLSYVAFHAGRPPLYGLFFNSLRALGLEETLISPIQLLLWVLALGLLVLEMHSTAAGQGWQLTLLACLTLFPMNTFMVSLVASFVSEGIFYPLLVIMSALCLRYLRCGGGWAMIGICAAVFAAVLLRGPVIGWLPVTVLVLLLTAVRGDSTIRRVALGGLTTLMILSVAVPVVLGRRPLEVSTLGGSRGFVLLPRVTMVASELPIDEPRRSQWRRLNESFVRAGATLSCAERSMFESQLQEAVRFELGPPILLGDARAFAHGWNGTMENHDAFEESASDLFRSSVRSNPGAYLKSTACHTWALLSAGTQLGSASRHEVAEALHRVDPETWILATFRKDYPLQDYDTRLRLRTELAYLSVRLFAIAATLIGVGMSLLVLYRTILCRDFVDREGVLWLLSTGWLFTHTLVIAASVFPDQRYVSANFLLQWLILILAVVKLRRSRVLSQITKEVLHRFREARPDA